MEQPWLDWRLTSVARVSRVWWLDVVAVEDGYGGAVLMENGYLTVTLPQVGCAGCWGRCGCIISDTRGTD